MIPVSRRVEQRQPRWNSIHRNGIFIPRKILRVPESGTGNGVAGRATENARNNIFLHIISNSPPPPSPPHRAANAQLRVKCGETSFDLEYDLNSTKSYRAWSPRGKLGVKWGGWGWVSTFKLIVSPRSKEAHKTRNL